MSSRNDKNMKPIKDELYAEHGHVCWLCGKKFKKGKLTGHHAIPYRDCHCTTKDNVLIACQHCHFKIINNLPYPSREYDSVMQKMRDFRDNHVVVRINILQ